MPSSSLPATRHVPIALGDRSYRITIGSRLWHDPAVWEGLPSAAAAVIVSNPTVAGLYATEMHNSLAPHFDRILLLELPDGEAHKDWPSLNSIFERLLSEGCDRRTMLFALGGGVVGDIAGFAAATYMRGIPLVQVPTTLLAQVDSSVGGKTAINHALGKNMIGAFYQPLRVVCNLDTLSTLSDRELCAGLAEVIKYGPIADIEFLDWVEANLDALLARDPQALAFAVQRCCEIKASIVSSDERESGLRAILNFGHTFGHAIEAGLGYGQWLHGEAVGCGMVLASELSVRLGLMPAEFATRIRRLCERARLPVRAPDLGDERYLELMRIDKKSEDGALRFVLVDSLGHAVLRPVPDDVVRETLMFHRH